MLCSHVRNFICIRLETIIELTGNVLEHLFCFVLKYTINVCLVLNAIKFHL